MGVFVKYILPILGLMIVFGIPFFYVLLTGRFGRGVGLTWFLLIVWYIFCRFLFTIFFGIRIKNYVLSFYPREIQLWRLFLLVGFTDL